ncbi:MAG: hypothetical protein MUO26_11150 [Methanotrichaceae archaeon]|nr:hypothetical protein [Methanotrichaceae archaeon]
MKREWIEIGISTGLVFLMIVMLLVVELNVSADLKSAGFALVVILFIIVMGLVGIKLADIS